MRLCVTLLIALGSLVPLEGSAQVQRTWSFDLTVGGGTVRSDYPYVEDGAILAELLLGIRWRREPGNSFIAAAGISGDPVSNGYDASCNPLPNGDCAPHMPRFISRHVVFGWEALAADNASVRLMAGPAWYDARYGGGQSNGFQVRLDLAATRLGPVSPAISGRWMHVASYQNTEIDYYVFNFGLRIR